MGLEFLILRNRLERNPGGFERYQYRVKKKLCTKLLPVLSCIWLDFPRRTYDNRSNSVQRETSDNHYS